MDTSTQGSGSGSSRECSPADRNHGKPPVKLILRKKKKEFWTQIISCCLGVPSPVHWRVWTRPGCRPESPCRCSAAPDPSACSRSEGSGRRCRPPTPAARAGAGTRRSPSPPPGGRCTAAPGGGWSCSTPAAAGIKSREYAVSDCGRREDSSGITLLSLPPDARCWWSGDHFRPHTSCL